MSVTPSDVRNLINVAESLENHSMSLIHATVLFGGLFVLHLLVILLCYMLDSKRKTHRRIGYFKALLTLVLYLGTVAILVQMFKAGGYATVKYLSRNRCSQDDTLNFAFVKLYESYLKMRRRNWTVFGFISAILFIEILVTVMNYHAAVMAKRRELM